MINSTEEICKENKLFRIVSYAAQHAPEKSLWLRSSTASVVSEPSSPGSGPMRLLALRSIPTIWLRPANEKLRDPDSVEVKFE